MKKTSCIFIALVLICFAPHAGMSQNSSISPELTPYQQSGRGIFRELIELNTSTSIGCTKAAEAMERRFKEAGFAASDLAIVGPSPQHKNLVVRYRGTGTLKPVLMIGHLDVVEARREDWTVDPFTFLERDGFFYGRGTTDMKGDDASLVASLIRLRQEKFVPDRDIIVALTEDEENGDANGIQWLLANRRDLIDAEYCINLDSGGGEIKNGRHTIMDVQTSEKVYIDYQFEARNKGGHSSLPVKDNAIYRLAGALTRLAAYRFPIKVNETTRVFFQRLAETETGGTKNDMLALGKIPFDTAAAERLAVLSPYYNSLLRTTCVATMLSGGHAPNALPQNAKANVNCRMHPDDRAEDVLAALTSVVADTQVAITVVSSPVPGPLSPLRPDVMKSVERVTGSLWPGMGVTPVMSTGASDGKFLRLAGIPVYGVSGMCGDVDDVRAHGRDERIGVKEYYEGIEFMARFIRLIAVQ